MREIIIPKKPLLTLVDFISIGGNQESVKINFFSQPQPNVVLKEYLAFRNTCVRAIGPDGQSGMSYGWPIDQFGHIPAILRQRT